MIAATMMNEFTDFESLSGMTAKMKNLRDSIEESATRKGLDPANDLFLVGTEHDGSSSSEAFVTHLYASANGLPPERFVTSSQLESMQKQGLLKNNRIVLLNDAMYSGDQTKAFLAGSSGIPNIAVASISSYSKFAKSMAEIAKSSNGKVELITLQSDISALDPSGALFKQLKQAGLPDPSDLFKESYSGLASLKVFPHMTPDTDPGWLKKFGRDLLLIASPDAPDPTEGQIALQAKVLSH